MGLIMNKKVAVNIGVYLLGFLLPSISSGQRVSLDSLYHKADFYFKAKEYKEAGKAGNKYIHHLTLMPGAFTLNELKIKEDKRYICWDFYEMYIEAGDYKHAIKYLKKIEKKYLYFFCGNSKPGYLNKLYGAMINCYRQLGDVTDAEKYQTRLYKDYE
jgi:hypothetical protein